LPVLLLASGLYSLKFNSRENYSPLLLLQKQHIRELIDFRTEYAPICLNNGNASVLSKVPVNFTQRLPEKFTHILVNMSSVWICLCKSLNIST